MLATKMKWCACSALVFLGGCALMPGSGVPIYKSDPAVDLSSMTPFTAGGISLALPTGWSVEPDALGGASPRAATIVNPELSASISLKCMPMMMQIGKMAQVLRDDVRLTMPDARTAVGTHQVEIPGFNPFFEIYSGTTTAQGRSVPQQMLIAWKLDSSVGACKYALQAVATADNSNVVTRDFIAIVHSLR